MFLESVKSENFVLHVHQLAILVSFGFRMIEYVSGCSRDLECVASSSKGTRRLSFEANISAIEPCNSAQSREEDFENEQNFENRAMSSSVADENPNQMVRFLSLSSISEEEVLNYARSENNNSQILNSSPVRIGDETENRTNSAIGGRGVSARLESTRQISFDDAAMISTIPAINPNDTLTLTEDSGFAAGSSSNVQQFAPALSSTHIVNSQQNQALQGTSQFATTDSGILHSSHNSLSFPNISSNNEASRNEQSNSNRLSEHSTNSGNVSSEIRVRTEYRDPIQASSQNSPSVLNAQSLQNLSFVNDESSRDQTVNTNLERAALDKTSAGIRDQFDGFEIRSSPNESNIVTTNVSEPKRVSPRDNMSDDYGDCTPKQKPKVSRISATPDLSGLIAKSSKAGYFVRQKSFGRELFNTDSSTHITNSIENQNSMNKSNTANDANNILNSTKSSVLNIGQKRLRSDRLIAKENVSHLSSSSQFLGTEKLILNENNRINHSEQMGKLGLSSFVPLHDSTNTKEMLAIKGISIDCFSISTRSSSSSQGQRGSKIDLSGTLKDVLTDQWWESRCNKET